MPRKTVGASLALHCCALALVIYASHAIPSDAASLVDDPPVYEKIYYPLPPANSAKPLPRIAPAGPGAVRATAQSRHCPRRWEAAHGKTS